jgi:hypothetical protein
VRHPGHLRLQPDQVLERRTDRLPYALEQQLPGQGGAAQRATAEDRGPRAGQSWMP